MGNKKSEISILTNEETILRFFRLAAIMGLTANQFFEYLIDNAEQSRTELSKCHPVIIGPKKDGSIFDIESSEETALKHYRLAHYLNINSIDMFKMELDAFKESREKQRNIG